MHLDKDAMSRPARKESMVRGQEMMVGLSSMGGARQADVTLQFDSFAFSSFLLPRTMNNAPGLPYMCDFDIEITMPLQLCTSTLRASTKALSIQ